MLTDSVSGEGSLPGLQTVTFSLCLHTVDGARELLGWGWGGLFILIPL